tara:strand:- start:5499 stop:6629 length:1131 start_codon:yes stop_codon:yes gene_type:complete
MIKKFIFQVLIFGFANAELDTVWTKTFGGELNDRGYGIVEIDNGFIITGFEEVDNCNNSFGCQMKGIIIRTDSLGNQIWKQEFGEDHHSYVFNIVETDDNNFAAIVHKNVHYSKTHSLLKFDIDGNILLEHTIPDSIDLDFTSTQNLFVTNDLGFVFSTTQGSLVKMDSLGNIEWYKNELGLPAWTLTKTDDGGYVVCAGDGTITLTKFNSDGVEIWEHITELGGNRQINDIIETQFYLIGIGDEDNAAAILVLWSKNGEYKEVFELSIAQRFWDIIPSNDGSFYVSGIFSGNTAGIGNFDIEHDGDDEFGEFSIIWNWMSTYGEGRGYNMHKTNNGDISLVGQKGEPSGDIWLLKLGPDGPPPPPPPQAIFIDVT